MILAWPVFCPFCEKFAEIVVHNRETITVRCSNSQCEVNVHNLIVKSINEILEGK
jgi:hypothetical protein